MKTNFKLNQTVRISPDNDNENYENYRGMDLVITNVATNKDEHPGYDSSLQGQGLYDLMVKSTGNSVPFSLYDYELIKS